MMTKALPQPPEWPSGLATTRRHAHYHRSTQPPGAAVKPFYFNIRANGIFADGFVDRDGMPVRDTCVYQIRAKMVGAAGRNWSKSQHAELAASLSALLPAQPV